MRQFFLMFCILGGIMVIAAEAGAATRNMDAGPRQNGTGTIEDLSRDMPETRIEPRVVQLDNGLTVLVQEDNRFPLASVRLYVHAGSAYETPEQAGISHLLEHMVFKGTVKRKPGQVAQDVEGVGGYLNAATSFDYTVYYVDVPATRWKLGLDVIQDMIFGAKIDPTELDQEKNVVLSELERGEDDPSQLLFKSLQRQVWKDSPYGRPVIGFPETVKGFTHDDIKNYINRLYQPQSMLLVVVGQVKAEDVMAEARSLFGGLKNDHTLTPPKLMDVPRAGSGPVVEVKSGQWNKVYLSAVFPTPGLKSAESAPLEVLAQIMGGDKTARLYRRFHYVEQLVDDISVSAVSLERGGLLYVSATLDADKLNTFWPELVDELKNLKASSFTDEEVVRAKLNLEDSLFRAKETLSGLASKLGHFQFFEGGVFAENNYVYNLANVDKRQIQGLIDSYLTPDKLYASLIQPEKAGATADALKAVVESRWPRPEEKFRAAKQAEEAGAMERVDLGEGRELVLLPDTTLPYTSVTMIWPGGDAILSPQEQGVSELTAKALALGTKRLNATRLQDFLSDRASHIGATAGRESFFLSAKFPSRFSADILSIFQEIIFEPAFDPADVERAKADQIASIKGREDEPLGLAFIHMFPFLFPGTTYGYFHLGTPEAIKGYDRNVVNRYWTRQVRRPWTLAVCGMYDRDAVVGMAKSIAGKTSAKPFDFVTPAWGKDTTKTLSLPDRNQTHLLLIFPTPGQTDPDSAGLSLLKTVLAGQGGILFRELRDKQGLGYTVTSFLWQTPTTGFLAFYIGTYPDKADKAMEGFRAVVEDLRTNPLPNEELDRAKNLLSGDYFREHQSLSSRSQEVAGLLVKKLPADYNKVQIDQAGKLTPQDILGLVDKYLNWDKKYVMRVDPR